MNVEYSGDETHGFSASFPLVQVVAKGDSSTLVSSSLNPSTLGRVRHLLGDGDARDRHRDRPLPRRHPPDRDRRARPAVSPPCRSPASSSAPTPSPPSDAGSDTFERSVTTALSQDVNATPLTASTTTLISTPDDAGLGDTDHLHRRRHTGHGDRQRGLPGMATRSSRPSL